MTYIYYSPAVYFLWINVAMDTNILSHICDFFLIISLKELVFFYDFVDKTILNMVYLA